MFSGSGSGSSPLIHSLEQGGNSIVIGTGLTLVDADSVNSQVFVEGIEAQILSSSPVEQLFFASSYPNISMVSAWYDRL